MGLAPSHPHCCPGELIPVSPVGQRGWRGFGVLVLGGRQQSGFSLSPKLSVGELCEGWANPACRPTLVSDPYRQARKKAGELQEDRSCLGSRDSLGCGLPSLTPHPQHCSIPRAGQPCWQVLSSLMAWAHQHCRVQLWQPLGSTPASLQGHE